MSTAIRLNRTKEQKHAYEAAKLQLAKTQKNKAKVSALSPKSKLRKYLIATTALPPAVVPVSSGNYQTVKEVSKALEALQLENKKFAESIQLQRHELNDRFLRSGTTLDQMNVIEIELVALNEKEVKHNANVRAKYLTLEEDLKFFQGLRPTEDFADNVLAKIPPYNPAEYSSGLVIPSLTSSTIPLMPGYTLAWLQEHNLLNPIPPKSVCQGCFVRPVLLQRYLGQGCSTCGDQHAFVIPDASIKANLIEGVNKDTVIFENADSITSSLRKAASSPNSFQVLAVTSGYRQLPFGHANALFFYLNIPEKRVNIRLYDPHVDTTYKGDIDTIRTKTLLGIWVPMYLEPVLPGWQVEFDAGESCPIGLQGNEQITYSTAVAQRQREVLIKKKRHEFDKLKREFDKAKERWRKQQANFEIIRLAGGQTEASLYAEYLAEPEREYKESEKQFEAEFRKYNDEIRELRVEYETEQTGLEEAEQKSNLSKDPALQKQIQNTEEQLDKLARRYKKELPREHKAKLDEFERKFNIGVKGSERIFLQNQKSLYITSYERDRLQLSMKRKALVKVLKELTLKQENCHIRPGGYCQAWSALITLLQIVFPTESVNTITADLWKNHASYLPTMRDLISRFSFNLFSAAYDPKIDKRQDFCCENEFTRPHLTYFPADTCEL